MFQLGIERLLSEPDLQKKLIDKRLALLAHPASTDRHLRHSLDLLMETKGLKVTAAFGPQHGMRGEKQDNMIESDDYVDPVHKIPVYSLYGKVRRPTPEMMKGWDVLLVDLQDVGCRIYTFLTTLFYMMDAVQSTGQEIWVLDRPNPAGREIEGHKLDMAYESFVGAAPVPMRHGLTLGEAALWYRDHKKSKAALTVIAMNGYDPLAAPTFGWADIPWVNPSPNMPRLSCARVYPGSVLIEGCNLSEGRGTTTPLEIFGAPGLDVTRIVSEMREMAPKWTEGCILRPAFYEPTFHKFKGELVSALQVHVDGSWYDPSRFKPYRLINLYFKAVHRVHPEFDLWRKPPYEYEEKLMPIDILSGNGLLREWVADKQALVSEWDQSLAKDEGEWAVERKSYLLY
ncbi:MAG: DUF1343 domain-containing protein [Bdellovibrionales bacterium]|nr:DUF1343 domain-containing protein [Bdellovibrionales bacterium]